MTTLDDVMQAIKDADNAYVAWQEVIRRRAHAPVTDPYGDEIAALETKYERAKGRADTAMRTWLETPHKITRVKAAEAVTA